MIISSRIDMFICPSMLNELGTSGDKVYNSVYNSYVTIRLVMMIIINI